MRARAWWVVLALAPVTASAGEPKPTPVDIKPIRDHLIVLQDAQGGTYVVLSGKDSRAFYGTGKTLYEQVVINAGSDGETGAWDIGVWAPRVPNIQPGSLIHKADGSFERFCGDKHQVGLSQVTGDKAKKILDQSSFVSTALIRSPHLIARDDAGIYYYVDKIRDEYGGKGFRVFVGKKGAMKQLPLTDIASDSAGEVFATKTGDLRLVRDKGDSDKPIATWVRGEKRTQLVRLDPDVDSPLIFKDLGVYTFIGTICDDL